MFVHQILIFSSLNPSTCVCNDCGQLDQVQLLIHNACKYKEIFNKLIAFESYKINCIRQNMFTLNQDDKIWLNIMCRLLIFNIFTGQSFAHLGQYRQTVMGTSFPTPSNFFLRITLVYKYILSHRDIIYLFFCSIISKVCFWNVCGGGKQSFQRRKLDYCWSRT